MRSKRRFALRHKAYVVLFVLLVVAYICLAFLFPADKATLSHYHLSEAGAHAISISVVVPLSIIWLVGLYGSLKLKSYSSLIKRSKEGKGLNTFATGFMVLALAQPLTAVISSTIGQIIRHHPSGLVPLTILNNYMAIILGGMGFSIMAIGAWGLFNMVRNRLSGHEHYIFSLCLIILSALYTLAIVTQPIHSALGRRIYFLPNWLVVLSIAIPYIFIWYLGILSSYCLYIYQLKVKGLVYKGSLIYVAVGTSFVVVSSIAVRFLSTTASINRLKITPILLVVYAFLLLLGIGFGLIAYGARKLRRIEEV